MSELYVMTSGIKEVAYVGSSSAESGGKSKICIQRQLLMVRSSEFC
jgi:hypothetical protein